MNNLMKTAGRTGNAGSLLFSGTDSSIEANNISHPDAFTYSCFIKSLGSTGNTQVIFVYDNGSPYNILIGIRTTLSIRIVIPSIDGTNQTVITSPDNLVKYNKWHNIICTGIKSSRCDCYVDGVWKFGQNITQNIFYNNGLPLRIGRRSLTQISRQFNGYIDNCKVYNRAVGANEAKLLSQGLPISRVGLLGEWKMNEMSGTTAYDTSGQGNHGTIVGATYSTDKPF
ncbi:MAG: LamG domain-containing protein [Tenuifilaceae bacterium]|nr:LamG domain-containing protein [Tenuifilaceae bacterium]